MMLQLNPPIPLKTPKGDAWATALIDYGPQWDLLWVTFIEKTGECWTFRNPEVRQGKNYTFAHPEPTPIKSRDKVAKAPLALEHANKKEDPSINVDFSAIPNFTKNGHAANGHANGVSNSRNNGSNGSIY
ncbi:MAG: hypothetical protein U1E36_08630 [Rickettsiales bacterium]